MTCIFPPVPGPKIKGFDTHLLEVSATGGECVTVGNIYLYTHTHTIP